MNLNRPIRPITSYEISLMLMTVLGLLITIFKLYDNGPESFSGSLVGATLLIILVFIFVLTSLIYRGRPSPTKKHWSDYYLLLAVIVIPYTLFALLGYSLFPTFLLAVLPITSLCLFIKSRVEGARLNP